MDKETQPITVVVLIGTIAGIGYCLREITKSPTANEALLLSLFMTLLSVLASWIVSRYYAKASYEDNLRVFARKAAEKVTNLSNELDRLSSFLQKALDDEEYDSASDELLAKTIRFEDAIHSITSLKSINDTSLSDWRGVIGEELTAQRKALLEDQEHREERLLGIMAKLEQIQQESTDSDDTEERQERASLQTELASLRSEMRSLATQVGGVSLRGQKRKAVVESACPLCSSLINHPQATKNLTTRKVECSHCHAKLYASLQGAETVLRERLPIPEIVLCPVCSHREVQDIDPLQGSSREYQCAACQERLRVIRTNNGVTVKMRSNVTATFPQADSASDGGLHELPEELLKKIEDGMGSQPWPRGKSHEVRIALGISRYIVDYGIKQLIVRGVFRPQVDGVIYGPMIDSIPKSTDPSVPKM